MAERDAAPGEAPCRAPARFLRPYASVEAMQFDGSRDGAAALARAFPQRVAYDAADPELLRAFARDMFGREALHPLAPGEWLVKVSETARHVDVMTDDLFRCFYTPDLRTMR